MTKNNELHFSKHTPYEVDFEYLETKVEFFLEAPNETPIKLSFWEIIKYFSEKKISEPVHGSFQTSFRIDYNDVIYRIRCENLIARQVLSVILNLQNEKKPIYSFWYLYDFNSCTESPQFIHSFFLANASKIQLDNVDISTSWMDKCDSKILIKSDSSMPLWSNMEGDQKATTLWYYQKFYHETDKGQILSIRENLKSVESISCASIDQKLLSAVNKKLKFVVIILILILLKMIF